MQFPNPYLHFTNNKLTIPKQGFNLLFSSNNPYFYSIPTKKLQINLS